MARSGKAPVLLTTDKAGAGNPDVWENESDQSSIVSPAVLQGDLMTL